MRKLNLLFTFLFVFAVSILTAQSNADYNITVTPSGGMIPCDVSNTTELVHIVSKKSGLNNFKITFTLPTGIEYVTGTVTRTGGTVVGGTITEDATSTATVPVFNITGAAWGGGTTFDFTFTRRAVCASINYSIGGGSFKDAFSASYTGGTASPLVDTDPAIAPYTINTAVLSVQPIATANANLGDVITPRNITVVQGGNGRIQKFVHKVVIANTNATVNYVLYYGGIPLVPNALSTGDTLYFDIDLSVAPFNTSSAATSGTVGYFDNGETITFQESFKVQRCEAEPARHFSQYGCNAGEVCYISASQPGNVIFGSQLPNITMVFSTYPTSAYYFCDTNHVEVTITNTNTNAGAAATDILIGIGKGPNSVNPLTYTTKEISAHSNRYQHLNYAVNGIPVTDLLWGNHGSLPGAGDAFVGIFDTLTFDPDGPGVGLEDLDGDGYYDDLGPGQSFKFSWDVLINPSLGSCVSASSNWTWEEWEHNYIQVVHRTQCGTDRLGKTLDRHYNIFGKYQEVSEYDVPTDIDGPSGANFNVLVKPGISGRSAWKCGNPSGSGSNEIYQIRIPLPPGISYDGVTPPNLSTTLNPSYFMDGDTLVYQLEGDGVGLTRWFNFPLTIDCNIFNSTSLSLSYQARFICDGGCINSDIYCTTLPTINTHCPVSCKGPITKGMEANRTTAGWTDNTKTAKVTLDPSVHNTKYYLSGDTMHVETYMIMSGDTVVDNLYYSLSWTAATTANLNYVPGSGEITINDISSGIFNGSLTGVPNYTGFTGSNKEILFDLSSYSTLVSSTYQYGEGNAIDTVWLSFDLVVPTSLATNFNPYPLSNFVGYFFLYEPDGVTRHECDRYGESVVLDPVMPYITPWLSGQTINECSNAFMRMWVWNRKIGYQTFPGEYRPPLEADSVVFTLPDYVEYISGSATVGNNAGVVASTSNASAYYNAANRTVTVKSTPIYSYPNWGSYYTEFKILVDVKCGAPLNLFPGTASTNIKTYFDKFTYSPNIAEADSSSYNFPYGIFNQPTYTLQSPVPVVQGVQSNISWDVQVDKTNSGNVAYNWLRIETIPGINITGVYAVSGSTETLLTSSSQGGYLYVQLGAMNGVSTHYYRIKADYTTCTNQFFDVNIGWGCSGYPSDYLAVDATNCYDEVLELGLEPKGSIVEINVDESSTAVPVTMCNPFIISMDVLSLDEANVENPYISFAVPGGVSALTINSVNVEYPAGSGNSQIVSTTVLGGNIIINLLDHTLIDSINGIYGTVNSSGIDGRTVLVTLNAQTNCNFIANSRIRFVVYGEKPCSGLAIGSGGDDFSAKIAVNGASSDYEIFHAIAPPINGIEGCSEMDTINFTSTIFSGLSGPVTGVQDTMKIALPTNVSYQSFTCNSTDCPTFISSNLVGGVNEVLFLIPQGLENGDELNMDMEVTSEMAGCDSVATIEIFSYVSASGLYCGATPCSNSILETGYQIEETTITKPNFIVEANLVVEDGASPNHNVTAIYTIDNTTSSLNVNPNIEISVYYDANNNQIYDAGTDVLLGTQMYNNTILAGSSAIDTLYFTATTTQLDDLILVARAADNACLCDDYTTPFQICYIENLPIHSDSVCLGEDIEIIVENSEIGKTYQLYDIEANSLVGVAISGTGSDILFSFPSTIEDTLYYKIFVENTSLGCSGFLKDSIVVIITDPLSMEVNAGNDTLVCPGLFTTSANNLKGYGVWTQIDANSSTGINSSTNKNETINLQGGLVYKFEWCVTSSSCMVCDTVEVVTENLPSIISIDTTICQGQSLIVNGTTYTANGFYQDTARYVISGCDSIQYNINLHIDSFIVENIDTTICQGQTLIVNGTTYTSNGFYQDTARYTVSNCDSIQYNINLHIDSFTVENIDTTICQGQSLIVNGTTYTSNGFYQDTARYTVSNCDSIQYNINLHIDSFTVENIDTTICQGQSLTVNGTTYNTNGFYQDTARYVASGCDSIQYNINLHIDSFTIENIDTTICQGQSLTVNGTTYTASGFYQDTARYVVSGCDSIQYNINLHIDSFTVENIDTTICQGQSLTVNGTTYTANGFYQDTARYVVSGCDSIQYNINLHIDSFIVENMDTTICQGQSLTVNGTTYTANGFYQDTARYTISGCDSIQYNINLHIDSFTVENIDTTICQGQSLTVNGVTYTANGFYQDTARYVASGCDSIQYNINLHIDSFTVENIDTTICQGQTLTVNGTSYTANGFYQDTARYTISGCDSIQYNINLHIDSFTVENIDTTICQGRSLTVNGTTYTANGFYQDTARYAVSGCDSVHYNINLHIDSFIVENIDTTICQGQSLTVNGTTYTANGFYQDTARYVVSGCDSIQYNINLHIDSFTVENIDTTICQGQSLTVNGITYTTNGFYQDTARYVVSGCDSIQYNINLHIDSFIVENIDTIICQGQSLTVNGTSYTANGFYQDTARYVVSGCDSIQYNINLHIDSFTVENIDTTICQGRSLTVNGTTYTANGFYQDTARYVASGCDSIQYNINLHIDSFIVENIDTIICQGQSLTVNGTSYTANGFYQNTARYVVSGCDSIQYNINLHIDSFTVENIDTTICQGQSLTVNGTTYTANGFYQDTARYVVSGCDSIQYNINLHIDSFIVENIDTTICQGQSLTVNGTTYTATGFYQDTARYAVSGCDSVHYNINLHIDSFTVENIDTTICQGQTLTINGITYNTTGFYQDTTRYILGGCDSVQFNINLTIGSYVPGFIDTTICQGQAVTFNGNTHNIAGTYYDTLYNAANGGCDSLFTLFLHIDSFTAQNIDTTICQGQSLTVNGTTYTATGFYQDTARYAISGCDSIHYTINLQIDSFAVITIDTTICQGQTYTLNGMSYTSTNTYYDTLHYALSGCDSMQYILNLQVDSFEVSIIDTTICQGQTYTLNGIAYTATNTYYDTLLHAISGCDSVQYILNLQVDSFISITIDTTICQGQAYILNGENYVTEGTYLDTVHYTQSGCDSIHYTINLQVDSFNITTIDTVICQGEVFVLNGINYNQTGIYFDTLDYVVSGCDSMQYVLNIQVDSFEAVVIDTTICQGQSLTVNGTTYTANGFYQDTARYVVSGCDSIQYNINLHIDSFTVENIDTTICQGQSLTVNGTTYTANGFYQDTARYTVSNCDSIQYNINLHIDSFTVENIDTTICQGQSLTVNGTTYNANGFYQDTTKYVVSGCDSIQFNINLHIDSFTVENIDTTICQGQSLTVNGTTYTANGFYQDTARYVISGCDSIQYNINLHIDSFTVENIDTTICQGQSLTVNGTTYTANGFYQDTARYVVSGCDSIQYNINLHIDSFTVENIDTTICQGQSLTVNGTSYTANGFYQDTARYVVSGCDSIQYNINLHIDSFTVENIDTTICQGQSLTVNGTTYTANGFYQDTARYVVSGCDSIQYNINLHIDSFTVENIDTTICQGQSLTVNGTTYTINGFYQDTARYTASGCDSVQFNINLHIDSIEPITLNDTICEGDIYTLNGINYTQSGTYYDTLYHTASGCDSIHYTLNLQRLDFVTDTIRQTICEGNSYTFNGNSYTTEGVYYDSTDYSYYACDSVHYVIFVDVDSVELITIPASICEGDTFSFNGTDYTSQNTYYDTLRYTISACDSVWYEIQLTVNPLPNVLATATPNDTVCENNQVTLNASGATQYSWNNSTVQTGIPFYPAVGTTQYVLTGIDANNCMNTDTINIVGLETAQTTVSYTICEDEFHTLPDGTQVNTAGTYTTTIPRVGTGCDSTITTQLNVNLLGVFDELQDIAVCSGLSQTIAINAQNMVSFEWFINEGSGDVSLLGNTNYIGANTNSLTFNLDTALDHNIYSVQMVDECGNSYVSSSMLEVFLPHLVENPLPDTTFCLHEIEVINVEYNGHDYQWNTGEFGSYILPDYSGDYIVNYIENHTNCLMSDTINITLEDCIGNCVVLAPTGFSPDGNGANDIFRVVTSCNEGFDYYLFNVYNRWGELIFSTNDWRQGWDGTYKGRDAEIGIYTYYVEYTKSITSEKGNLKGNVTLIR